MWELVKYTFEDSVSPKNLKWMEEEGGNVIIDLFCLEQFGPTPDDPARVRMRELFGRLFVIIETNDTWVWSPKMNDWVDGEALLEELERQASM